MSGDPCGGCEARLLNVSSITDNAVSATLFWSNGSDGQCGCIDTGMPELECIQGLAPDVGIWIKLHCSSTGYTAYASSVSPCTGTEVGDSYDISATSPFQVDVKAYTFKCGCWQRGDWRIIRDSDSVEVGRGHIRALATVCSGDCQEP